MLKKIIIYTAIFSISIFSMMPLVQSQSYEKEPELISLDIKGMDIRDVLKILSQKSGLNIVADKDVKGTIVLYVKDVAVMDALNILVSTNDLAYELEGSLLRIMTDKTYERLHGEKFDDRTKTEIVRLDYANATEITKAITKMKTKIGKIIPDDSSNTIVLIDAPRNVKRMKDAISEMDVTLVTEVFSLDYANAESIKGKLEEMLSKNSGSMRFDERTNKIIVKDTPKKIEDIKKVVEAFDEKTREVVIDANIIEVTLYDKYSSGIDWAAIATLGDIAIEGTTNLTTRLLGPNTIPSDLTISKKDGAHSTVIKLLETFGETNILSRPRITVADKEEAKILVGKKEAYVTSTTSQSDTTSVTSISVNFIDVGLMLYVTPAINKDGFVTMKIKPEISSAEYREFISEDKKTEVPIVSTSEVETTVLVKDGTTVIIGGLMKDTVTEYKEKIPFLGDVPLLGKLFSTKGKSKIKTELVILLTPHIIEGDKTTEEVKFYKDEWAKYAKSAQIESPEEEAMRMAEDKKARSMSKTKKLVPKKPVPAKLVPEKPVPAKAKAAKTPKKQWSQLFTSRPKAAKAKSPLDKSAYETYYMALRKEVNNISKKQDVSGKKGEVELQFSLDREGFLVRGPIVLNKPDLQLVRAAVNSVKMAVPFGAFPKGIEQKEAEFYLVVRYE